MLFKKEIAGVTLTKKKAIFVNLSSVLSSPGMGISQGNSFGHGVSFILPF